MDRTDLLKTLSTCTVEDVTNLVLKNETIKSELGMTAPQRTGVQCPVIQEEIVVKCMVNECPYYTDMSMHHNCALVYLNTNSDTFGTKDLAILYRQPHNQVKSIMDTTMATLKGYLSGEADPTHGFFPLAGVCVTCELPIEEDTVSIDGCEYCSSRCATRLPPAQAKQGYIPS